MGEKALQFNDIVLHKKEFHKKEERSVKNQLTYCQ